MKTKQRTTVIYSVAAAILGIPLIAMQFTTQVDWSLFDFAIMGFLLFSTGTVINLVLNHVKLNSKRFIYISLALIVLILIWIELAIGIFRTPFAGN